MTMPPSEDRHASRKHNFEAVHLRYCSVWRVDSVEETLDEQLQGLMVPAATQAHDMDRFQLMSSNSKPHNHDMMRWYMVV